MLNSLREAVILNVFHLNRAHTYNLFRDCGYLKVSTITIKIKLRDDSEYVTHLIGLNWFSQGLHTRKQCGKTNVNKKWYHFAIT